jgi:hypothetical protein
MPLSAGDKLGHHEVLAPIGADGERKKKAPVVMLVFAPRIDRDVDS